MRDYTVKQLAGFSGVSVRALHHYHEIGLLKPAHMGANGYRYYGRRELLRLQQILFHRELGLPLEEIRKILDAPDFDQASALRSHRQRLEDEIQRHKRLIRTIDDTLAQMEGDTPMNEKAYYKGLDPKRWAEQDRWAVERYGSAAQASIERRNDLMAGWPPADSERIIGGFQAIRADLAQAFSRDLPAGSDAVRGMARRFFDLLNQTAPAPLSKDGFLNVINVFAEHPHFRSSLEAQSPGLTDYVIGALRAFCEDIV
jgi:DNA-binding transcriptional MerR regulator